MSRPPGDEHVPTVIRSPNEPPRAETASFLLIVVEGPDTGARFTVDATRPSRVLAGQSPSCEILLHDPEVSRRHAALEATDAGLRLTDLGSTNGTWVDRVKVMEAELFGDELVRMGGTMLRVEREEAGAVAPPEPAVSFGRMIGASPEMRRIYPLCARLARADVPVILEGETGTGKEILAESLHEQGARAAGPFVVFDCTAIPPSLLESELFGHERGAFTGAVASRRGVFEQAHGGTLLIDEIGELDLSLQPKLLRAIERSEIRRVGGDRWILVDVRVIAATRRDLDREVQAGRFRDDLLHRLAVARIELPPLRHRRGDVTLLARHFWSKLSADVAEPPLDALHRWEDYAWPGNVRELRNAVARQHALGDLSHMMSEKTGGPPSAPPADLGGLVDRLLSLPFIEARDQLMEEFERRYVQRVLDQHGGDVARAAEASGIGRRYFQKIRARNR